MPIEWSREVPRLSIDSYLNTVTVTAPLPPPFALSRPPTISALSRPHNSYPWLKNEPSEEVATEHVVLHAALVAPALALGHIRISPQPRPRRARAHVTALTPSSCSFPALASSFLASRSFSGGYMVCLCGRGLGRQQGRDFLGGVSGLGSGCGRGGC